MDIEQKILKKDLTAIHKKFLLTLQLEYLTHKLRSIIYREPAYADVSFEICTKKKEKIISLGQKFGLPSIFEQENHAVEFINNYFWNTMGLPNCKYKNAEQKRVQGNYDAWYLFYCGTEVMYDDVIATVLINNPAKYLLKIQIGEEKFWVNYMEVSIITDKLNQKLLEF